MCRRPTSNNQTSDDNELEISRLPSGVKRTKKLQLSGLSHGARKRTSLREGRSQIEIPRSFQPPQAAHLPSGLMAIVVMRSLFAL